MVLASMYSHGAVLILAHTLDDVTVSCTSALQLFARQARRVYIVTATEVCDQPSVADRPVVLSPTGNLIPAGNELSHAIQILHWSLEPTALGYTENTIHCLKQLIDSTNASLVLAPSITEQNPLRFILGLTALESNRRSDGSFLLGYYFVEAEADAFQMCSQRGYRLRLLCFPTSEGSRITNSFVSENGPPVDHSASRQIAIGSHVMLMELISPADNVEPISYLHERTFPDLIGCQSVDPLVSIVIRTTNRPELSDALASIAAQTYTHIEVLLVDVAGTGLPHIGERCGAFPLKVVSTGYHLNRSAAANTGLDAALGDYVCFLDDDDWLYPKHVHSLVSALQPEQPARAAYVGVECREQNAAGDWEIIHIFNERFDPVRLLIENYLPMHAVMFDRNLLGPQLRFDEQLHVYEDWDFWMQLSQLTPFIHVDCITAVYRISSSSGFGLRGDDPEIASGTRALFGKWRKLWSESQVIDFINYQKLRIQEQAQQTQEQVQAQTDRITKLEDELAESAQDHRLQLQRVNVLEAEARERDASYQASIEEIARLQQELANVTTAYSTNKRLSVELNKRIDALDIDLRTAKQEIDSLRPLEWRINLYRQQLLVAENRVSRYSRGLSQLHSAAIWPITSRLHALGCKLPRLTRAIMAAQKALWWALCLKLPARLRLRSQARKILASGLFDEQWYIEHYPDAVLSGCLPVFHWCLIGWRRGYYPCPLFHTSWYQKRYNDELQADQNPLLHYIDNAMERNLDPNPLFDANWYVSSHLEVQETSDTPLLHYLTTGWRLGLSPHPLFDINWYLAENPVVAQSDIEPLGHYFELGAFDDCDPHPLFMSSWYLDRNPDVFHTNINPLYHYLAYGASEGRDPNPMFDTDWYAASNIDVVNAGFNPLVHYVLFGASEAYPPHPDFDPDEYQAEHPAVDWSIHNPLVHFLRNTQTLQSTGGFTQIIPETIGNEQPSKAVDPAYARWLKANPLGANRIRSLVLGAGLSPHTTCGSLHPAADLDAWLPQVEQVTFDLFDTLVERAATQPTDVFQLVGMSAPGQFGGARFYAKARIMAETRARENAAGEEVTLEAIFAELAAEAGLTDSETALLRSRELEIEEALIQVKPSGRWLYDRAADNGKHISILTDTYLPRSFVESVLEKTGYDRHDALFVSSHVNATKHFGTLFQLWQQQTGSSPSSVLHIGDNHHSDVSVPKRLGFKTLQVERSVDLFRAHAARAAAWPETSIKDPSMRLLQGLVANRLAMIGQQSNSSAAYLGNPYLLGYATLGPMLVGFTAGLLDFAARHHVRHLCFLARDGYIMKAAYDIVASRSSEPLPQSHYIAASRALCGAAGIDSIDRIRDTASVPHRPMSISALLRHRFGFDEQQIRSLPLASYSRHQLAGPDELLTESDPRKFAFLDSIAEQLIALSSERAERYAAYLNSLPIHYGIEIY
ncbi:MAG: glycosyltransferase [Thiohalocapsa sp. PB-PSB1]|nr:MAG: glycosyltransferase [Thiohalocapsa sp. PB-PSB1]